MSSEFRIEANQPIDNRFLPKPGGRHYTFHDRSLAVAMAAKSFTKPSSEIRVVHVPTGEVVFRKAPASREWSDDLSA